MVYTGIIVCVTLISPEPLNGFAPNSQGRRVWSLTRTSLNVKGQRRRSPATKMKNSWVMLHQTAPISRQSLNGFAPNLHIRRVWSLTRTSFKVKIKDQGQQRQKMHLALLSPVSSVRMVCTHCKQQQQWTPPFSPRWVWFLGLACGVCLEKHL